MPNDVLSQMGDYQLLAKVGEGGMGAVYRARHVRLDRVVALKVLEGASADDHLVARFQREMAAVGRLNHAGVVQAYDAREIDGVLILAMEYVEGLTLAKIALHTGRLPIAEACEAIRQAALGLDYIHRHQMVHRDIKPSNLMVTCRGEVKILDLGLALMRSGPAEPGAVGAVGTADYIAPEQALNSADVDARADLYSLGCTLFRLLAGQAPFGHPEYTSSSEKVAAHACRPVPPIGTFRSDVPEQLAAVLERAVAKDPNARFSTAAEFAAAVEPFAADADLAGLVAEVSRRMNERIELPEDASRPEGETVPALAASPANPAGSAAVGEPPGPAGCVVSVDWRKAVLAAGGVIALLLGAWLVPRMIWDSHRRVPLPHRASLSVDRRVDRAHGNALAVKLDAANRGFRAASIRDRLDRDFFRFTTQAEGTIEVLVTPVESLALEVHLFDGQRDADGDGRMDEAARSISEAPGRPCRLETAVRVRGRYYLLISSKDDLTCGAYEIRIRPVESAAEEP